MRANVCVGTRAILAALSLLLPTICAAAGPLDWPEGADQCRPWAYNWWLGSAVDRENLGREMQRYRQGGLGGIHIVPIYGAKGAEERYIDYLSPRWLEMLAFAVEQGKRLGLGVDMTTGTGWCFGGPNIPAELGCRTLVVKRLAFPADKRLPKDLRPPLVAVQAVIAVGPDGQHDEITDRLQTDGTLAWTPPGGGWSLQVLGHRFAGRMVKRAAPGGAGPMINPYYAESMTQYLKRFSDAFKPAGVARPRAMYHDSFEYSGNWSPDLPAEFAQRRGYRIESQLEALAGQGDRDRVARVHCDVSETRSDLVIERVFPQWIEWCHARGIKTRNQAHGAPANWLDFYALADIPETEMFGHGGPDPLVSRFDAQIGGADRDVLISKFASSAAHVAGKPLVSSETGTWLAEHFCETFEELKCEVDLLFLAGVNHIFYHGCVYSPDDAAWPGWLFYASTQMNPRNPLWREAPALNQYIARCQSILRSGQPDNDLLVYWPIHDAWSRGVESMSVHNKAALKGPLGAAARRLWARGYGFDYVSDRLLQTLHAEQGRIQGPDGVGWQAIVVPQCEQMPDPTLAKLVALARAGATVVFERDLPRDVPGLGRLAERRASLAALLQQLAASEPNAAKPAPPAVADGREPAADTVTGSAAGALRDAPCGKGRVLVGELDEALAAAGVKREVLVEHEGTMFLRRRHPSGRTYLIVHHGLEPLAGWIPLATPARSAVVLDPMTGETGVADVRQAGAGNAQVRLRLEPGHSIILRTFQAQRVDGPRWSWHRPGDVVATIDGPWQVEFIAGGPALPRPLALTQLQSWTSGSDSAVEAFAGTARYRCHFDWDGDLPDRSVPLLLDLGEVKHVARLAVNGRELGVLMMHPYRRALPAGLLRAKNNLLEVEVTNLAANRIRDLDRRGIAWRIFHDINLVNIGYRPFDASDWPVFASGLLGPVRVVAADAVR